MIRASSLQLSSNDAAEYWKKACKLESLHLARHFKRRNVSIYSTQPAEGDVYFSFKMQGMCKTIVWIERS